MLFVDLLSYHIQQGRKSPKANGLIVPPKFCLIRNKEKNLSNYFMTRPQKLLMYILTSLSSLWDPKSAYLLTI